MNGGIEIKGLDAVVAKNRVMLLKLPGAKAKALARIAHLTVANAQSNAPISPTKAQYEQHISAKRAQKTANRTGKSARVRFKSKQTFNPGQLQASIRSRHSGSSVEVFVPSNSPAGKYADFIHNGTYKLGIGSRAKAAAGHDVGPKFLTRAVPRSKISRILSDTISKIVKG
jgi:hypothetical protein